MKTIKLGKLCRSASVERAAIDDSKRTVSLSFSSEAPVDRWFGREVLDHNPSSVMMDRLRTAAPLLMDHNTCDQVGVVETAKIEGGRGQAVVRFGNSSRAQEIWQDVKDGIRTLVSVGYRVHKMVLDSQSGEDKTYRATQWEPMEISLVSVPADKSVGIGRADEEGELFDAVISNEDEMVKEDMKMNRILLDPASGAAGAGGGGGAAATQPANGGVTFDRAQIMKDATHAENKRVQEIRGIAAKISTRVPNANDLADQAVASFQSVDEFRQAMFERVTNATKIENPNPLIGMTERDLSKFSMTRAIAMAAKGKLEGLEGEMCAEACRQYKHELRGANSILIPQDFLNYRQEMPWAKRDQLTGTGTLGGNLVATNLLAGSFIDILRNRMLVARMGATYLDGLVGNVAIPRQSGAASVFWASSEAAAVTESSATFDQVTMSPKQVLARIDVSWLALQQTTPSIDALIRNDLNQIIARGIDLAALHGTGSSGQPTGIASVSGIGSTTGGANGAVATWANIVALETAVAAANADLGSLGYLTNAKQRGRLKQVLKNTAGTDASFIWQDNPGAGPGFGLVNGYTAGVSNQVSQTLTKGTATTACAVFFGNWADLLIGQWSGLELLTNPYTQASNRVVEVYAYQALDINVRHPESFAAMLDALP